MRWIRAWSVAHPAGAESDDMCWYPHGVAVRTLLLATVYPAAVCRWRTAEVDLSLIECELDRHRQFLADPYHFEQTNHGMTEALALIDAQRILEWSSSRVRPRPGDATSGGLVRLGVDRFLQVIDLTISAGGVCMEGAPAYHLYFLDHTVRALSYLCEVLPEELRSRLDTLLPRLARSYENAWYLVGPRGRLPAIGDTEVVESKPALARIGRQLAELAARRPDQAGDSSHENPDRGHRLGHLSTPIRSSVLYDEEAGFAAFKEIGGRHGIFRIQDRMPAAHAHNDALALWFSIGEIEVFCDSGKYSYGHEDPIRRYVTSRFAHNTAEPRNLDLEAYVVAEDRDRLAGSNGQGFTATVRVDEQHFRQRRTVWFPSNGVVLHVIDELESRDGYLLKWHLGVDLRLNRRESTPRTVRFVSRECGLAIEIRADHEFTCDIGPLQDRDPLGWRSERWGAWQACPVLLARPNSLVDAARYRIETLVRRIA